MKCIYLDISDPNTIIDVTEDTQFVLNTLDTKFETQHKVIFEFKVPGVSAQVIGAYVADKENSVNLYTETTHIARNTSCNTDIRGVLLDNGDAKYMGKIKILPSAQQTSSFLDDGVLVVGKGTHHRADPMLEIEANDVKASHGSTTGRIDPGQLYYLSSRGLSVSEAERLLIEGYLGSVILDIIDPSLRDELMEKLLRNV